MICVLPVVFFTTKALPWLSTQFQENLKMANAACAITVGIVRGCPFFATASFTAGLFYQLGISLCTYLVKSQIEKFLGAPTDDELIKVSKQVTSIEQNNQTALYDALLAKTQSLEYKLLAAKKLISRYELVWGNNNLEEKYKNVIHGMMVKDLLNLWRIEEAQLSGQESLVSQEADA